MEFTFCTSQDGTRLRVGLVTPAAPSGRDLLIVHGMIDENVHFRHAARLVDRLLKAGVPHTLIAFPDERHMPRGEQDRRALEARICGFLMERLSGNP